MCESIFEFLLDRSREQPTLQKHWFFTSKPLQDAIFTCSRFFQTSHGAHAKISPMTLSDRLAQKILSFFALGLDLASILVASARSRTLLGGLFGIPMRLGDSLSTPGSPGGRSETLRRRSPDAFGTLLCVMGRPERAPDAISTRFWISRDPPGSDFGWIFALIFAWNL